MDLTDFRTGQKGKRTKRSEPEAMQSFIYGKVPPQAKELEEAVLGAMMLHPSAIDLCTEVIKAPEVFYVDANKRIFKAIVDLRHKSQPTDLLSVIAQLRATAELDFVGGPYYVTKLTNLVVSAGSITHHSKIIFQMFLQRKIIEVGGEMVLDGYEDTTDPFELLDRIEEKIFALSNSINRGGYQDMTSALVRFVQTVEGMRGNQGRLSGVSTGFPSINRITNGWQPTDLIILAARPSVGKTAFALNLARNAATDPFKPAAVGFFSLEMSTGQLVQRLVAMESGINLDKISRGRIDEAEMAHLYENAIQKLSKMPLYIDDSAALNIFELRAKARRMKVELGIGLLVIDYLQLMSGNGKGNREQEISEISRSLKALAKELEIPIIALSQLSREPEKRTNKLPQLSDLRESGAIEQDADAVLFLFRPEYYDIHSNATGDSTAGETHVRVAKNRNGSLETIKMKAQLYIQKFIEDTEGRSPIYKGTGLDYKKMASGERNGTVLSLGQAVNPQIDEAEELPF